MSGFRRSGHKCGLLVNLSLLILSSYAMKNSDASKTVPEIASCASFNSVDHCIHIIGQNPQGN